MRAQYLDRMDIERERGITIKSQAVRMPWELADEAGSLQPYILNMIDTPGHVDFTYEVSRSLAACEGAVLLVDAAQGIEAQTLANLYLAMENDLHVIPVLNKIDLPAATAGEVRRGARQAHRLRARGRASRCPARPGGGPELLDEIVRQIPPPVGDADAPGRAMIFDSVYDTYRGVVTYVRVIDGNLNPRERIDDVDRATTSCSRSASSHPSRPRQGPGRRRGGLPHHRRQGRPSVPGRRHGHQRRKPATDRAGRLPRPQADGLLRALPDRRLGLPDLRDALDKLKLNDAALVYEPETSVALGFGFRCGFLGLLHLEIVRERLEREFDLDLISTQPNVVYRRGRWRTARITVTNPSEFPAARSPRSRAGRARHDPRAERVHRHAIMELCQPRGTLRGMDYLSEDRVEMRYTLPLAEIVFDFFDQLKSRTRGYASLDYEPDGEQVADLVKVDILLQGEPVDAFSAIVHKDKAYGYGVMMAGKLKELIPRQQFEVPIQAAIGARIIARENIRAIRKDVLAKCYGGDITRKRKLLEKQKEGKKRMKMVGGRSRCPQEAFIAGVMSLPGPLGCRGHRRARPGLHHPDDARAGPHRWAHRHRGLA
jgi:GTP-binding protein LepA